jgi:uncharacterized protein YjbJ (UPF0337 family)
LEKEENAPTIARRVMNKDRVKGMIDEVAGSAKRKAGRLTGNTQLKVEGMVQQAKGKAEGAWGKAKDAVCDAIEGADVHLNAHVKLGLKNSAADAECRKCK